MPAPDDRGDKAAGLDRYERLARYGHLIVAAPGLACAAIFAIAAPMDVAWRVLLLGMAVAATFALARWRRRRLMFPLYALSGLLEALREGDYSLRGSPRSALGDLVFNFNALADRLHRERLEFEESSHLLGKTLSSLDSAVFVFDEAGRLRLLNPAAQRLMDRERHHLFGRTAAELGLDAWLAGAPARVLAHAFPGRTGRFEVRRASLRSDGRSGHLLVINDVSAVLREEERQAWQRLLRVLGHEVNNSLAPIRSVAGMLATMLERDPLPDDWREDFRGGVEVIGHRAAALGRFLSSYGKLARLPPPRRSRVDMAALVRKLAALEQGLPIDVDIAGKVSVSADSDQLEQALINLLRNAVEAAAPEGGGVRLRCYTEAGNVRVEIEDDGPGPPASENLFVPFFTTKPDGSGIGLALARQIAEAHDGGVMLAPRADGRGAVASLWLPVAAAETAG